MRAVAVAFLLVAVATATSAHADPAAAPAKDPPEGGAPAPTAGEAPAAPATPAKPARDRNQPRFSHKGQLGLSARFALGFRGIATYHDTDYCGATSTDTNTGNAPVCVTRAPFALELEASYGVARHIELLVELKLGLEHDFGSSSTITDGPHTVLLAPGLRYFFSEGKSSKLFTTAQVVFDFTGYQDVSGTGRGTDFGVRNLNGVWFDLHPSYGFYIFAGETLSVAHWLDFGVEAGIGVQGRYP